MAAGDTKAFAAIEAELLKPILAYVDTSVTNLQAGLNMR